MSNKDSLPSMSGDLTLPKKDEIKFADYKESACSREGMRKHQPLHRKEAFPEGEPREDPCRQRERSEVPWLLLLHMKGKDSLVRPSEDQEQTAKQA